MIFPFSRHKGLLAILALTLPLSGLLSCGDDNPTSATGLSIEPLLPIINLAKTDVQKIRELSFTRTVNVGLLTREQYSKLNNEYTDTQKLSNVVRSFKQIGFIPDTFSNLGYFESSSDNFAGAYYMPGTDSVYIIDPDIIDPNNMYFYLAHEFTHALQEQYFNPFTNYIYSGAIQSTLNSDFYLSWLSVYEGDASLSGLYTFFNANIENAFKETENYINTYHNFYDSLTTYSIPRYIDIQGLAPYYLGEQFVLNLYKTDRWNSVNKLYHSNRVTSMSEIITGQAVKPYVFDFSDIMSLLLQHTTKLVYANDDTYGPLMLMALLSENVDLAHCKNAFGWQGDRLAYTLSDNQAYGSFVWAMKFATAEDAEYIRGKLDTLYTARNLGRVTAIRSVDSTGTSFKSSAAATFLQRNGSFVYVIENVADKQEMLAALDTGLVLAKNASCVQSYSTVSFDTKKKVLDNMFGLKNTPHIKMP